MTDYSVRALFAAKPLETLSDVRVRGWVRTSRESKTIAFIVLNDGSCFTSLQVVAEQDNIENYAETLKRVSVGASIECEGDIVPTPEMKQPFELHAKKLTVLGDSPVDYPSMRMARSLSVRSTWRIRCRR